MNSRRVPIDPSTGDIHVVFGGQPVFQFVTGIKAAPFGAVVGRFGNQLMAALRRKEELQWVVNGCGFRGAGMAEMRIHELSPVKTRDYDRVTDEDLPQSGESRVT